MVWEFTSNGGVIEGTMHGRYSFGDNQRIKIETPVAASVYHMQVVNDRLILTDPRGTKLEFTRIKDSP